MSELKLRPPQEEGKCHCDSLRRGKMPWRNDGVRGAHAKPAPSKNEGCGTPKTSEPSADSNACLPVMDWLQGLKALFLEDFMSELKAPTP